MNSISMICGFSMRFEHPLLLLLLIPAVGLMLWPFFRISRQHRKTRNRIVSLAIHSLVLVLCVSVIAGLSFHTTRVSIKSDVILLVDASDSNGRSEDDMNEFIHALVKESDSGYSIGIVTFANGCVYTLRNWEKTPKKPIRTISTHPNAPRATRPISRPRCSLRANNFQSLPRGGSSFCPTASKRTIMRSPS